MPSRHWYHLRKPKPPMPPGKGAPEKKFDPKSPEFMKHRPPTQDRERVRGKGAKGAPPPPGGKGAAPRPKVDREEMDRQMNAMHDWWCKESADRMSTELCSTW